MNKLFFFIYFILLILIPINDLKSNQSNENILEADKIEYINESGKILATGSVLIIREGYKLEADKVSLDPSKNIIEAEGNIRINEGNGGLITASKIKISSNLNDGIIELPRIVTKDGTVLTSDYAIRNSGKATILEKDYLVHAKNVSQIIKGFHGKFVQIELFMMKLMEILFMKAQDLSSLVYLYFIFQLPDILVQM